ncbi:hypothetical protein IFR05_013044 [Cadophora sp. M221]|nr:hypothetical protein IFR05_013044 [Cadophora sp. M221]
MNPPSPLEIDYLLSNQAAYNPSTNYTRVHYTQVNQTGEIKASAAGRWVFYTYPFLDCAQVGGDDFKMEEYPWFETSCQTGVEGECRDVVKSVRSFAIGPAERYDRGHGQCEVWAELGGAGMLEWRREVMAVVGVAMLALALV